MKKETYFLLTVDTEEEWNWNGPFPEKNFSTENILSGIPSFQEFCEERDIVPTYFVDYAVAEKSSAISLLKKYFVQSKCDIGAHLHPWCTPPFEEEVNIFNSYITNLPIDLVKEKLSNVTQLLQNAFGVHPFSFRSGRWGMSKEILQLLFDLGYKVDSSIRPFYKDSNFNYEKEMPSYFWPDRDNILKPGDQKRILELPVTTGFTRKPFAFWNMFHKAAERSFLRKFHLIGILWRLNIVRKITVTPEGYEPADITKCIDKFIENGQNIINMFIHSSDLVPGNTCYVQNKSDLKYFFATIDSVVSHMKQRYDVKFLSIRDTYKKLS